MGSSRVGTAMASGLFPTTGSAPPGAGMSGRVFAMTRPTAPRRAISRANRPAAPKWNAFRIAATAAPWVRARRDTSSTA